NSSGGNPTLTSEPFTSEFILEEIKAYLKDGSISPETDHVDCDQEEDICLIEKLLNNDPFQLHPMDLKQSEVTKEKSSIEEPPELELKDLPSHLEYAYLEENDKLPVIIAKGLKNDEKEALLKVLKSHKRAIAWKITDIKGIDPHFCTHKILMEDDYKPTVQSQRRVNPKIHEVIKKEVLKLLDAGMIYPISDSPWVSPVHCVPKKGGITVVANDTFRYFQIPIDPQDQEKTTFTCPYGTFAYRRMPFGLCNAPGTFQWCMMAIFHDMIEKTMEVFMDDFSVFGDSFDSCLSNLEKMLKRCEDEDLEFISKLEKCHFMLKKEGPAKLRLPLGAPAYKNLISSSVIKKGSENLAEDHLSRLENPHRDMLENKDINENFPLETLEGTYQLQVSPGSLNFSKDENEFGDRVKLCDVGANGNVRGVNGNVEGVNGGVGGAPNFSTIISQQLQNLLPAILAQVGNQGNVGNQNGNVVNENVRENIRNELVNGNRDMSGCSIEQKVKYTASSFVGKALTWWNSQICTLSREVVVSMSWNDFKFMMIEEFCPSHEMQKLETELWNHAMVGASHAAYTDRFHELARLIHMMVVAMEPKTMQKVVQISSALTDEAVRNGSIKKFEKRGNIGEPSKDKNGKDDNKRTRTENAFATIANPVGRENTGYLARDCRVMPRNVNPVNVRNPTPAREACHECGSIDHLKPACLRLNRAQGPGGNRPNQVAANNGGQGRGNQENQARGRAFILGAEEAHQDPNIVTGTFTLNNHFATTLSDSGADYSFVSTTFIPLLGIEPSELGFRYEIEIANGQLVEIDKVIKGCELEIEGYVFDIDLIPFRHGSFDVVIGERPEEKARLLMSAKASDKKQEEIVVVRDLPESSCWDNSRNSRTKVSFDQAHRLSKSVGLQKGLDEMIEQRSNGTLYYLDLAYIGDRWSEWHTILDFGRHCLERASWTSERNKLDVHLTVGRVLMSLRKVLWLRFGRKGGKSEQPRFVGPFEIIEKNSGNLKERLRKLVFAERSKIAMSRFDGFPTWSLKTHVGSVRISEIEVPTFV
ncbi:reverse transcriptase domain-containing protein, partial [Tanacetum coccineum]